MSQSSVHVRRVAWVVGVLIVAGGCASSSQRAARTQLERAKEAYRQADSDPAVQAYAQPRLADAQKALKDAEQAKHNDEMLHLAYLAEKRARIAAVTGAIGKTEHSMEQLRRESAAEEVLLQKRDRELKAARTETDTKAREAEQWRRLAEARAKDEEAKGRDARQTEDANARALAAEQAKAAALAKEVASAEQAKAAALAKEVESLKAQHTDRGMVLTVGDVLFSPGKADVGPGAQRSIDKLAAFLRAYPRRNVLIEGHTDNLGDADFNIKLSQQRADAVRDLLIARGIAPERIRTKGYGPKFPVVDNDSAAGRQQNRRVEVIVLNEGVNAEGATR
jgi:outer membrane protein OmpA-like peptidoglycan-associated protein